MRLIFRALRGPFWLESKFLLGGAGREGGSQIAKLGGSGRWIHIRIPWGIYETCWCLGLTPGDADVIGQAEKDGLNSTTKGKGESWPRNTSRSDHLSSANSREQRVSGSTHQRAVSDAFGLGFPYLAIWLLPSSGTQSPMKQFVELGRVVYYACVYSSEPMANR